jgi:TPR repeat protein
MRYYREAANKNGPAAGYFIGILYERGLGVPADLEQARAWMKKAADLGSGDAQSWLALH